MIETTGTPALPEQVVPARIGKGLKRLGQPRPGGGRLLNRAAGLLLVGVAILLALRG